MTNIYVLEVEHPALDGNALEIEAETFTQAVIAVARRCPGIHIKKLVMEYPAHLKGGTA